MISQDDTVDLRTKNMKAATQASGKVGRNDPCPCNSGKKFKRCHANIRPPRAEMSKETFARIEGKVATVQSQERQRLDQFGRIRPVITAEAWGKRLVTVHNRIFAVEGRNFLDFLAGYMPHACGSGWWEKECQKPADDRHTVVKWYDHLYSGRVPGKDGMLSVVEDGIFKAFFCLAYDLYVLRDQAKLEKEVVRRLVRPERYKFAGARHELFVAATFLRAGFDIEYEDERDPSRTHPEFVATHKETKFRLAVEAKARYRSETKSIGRPKAGMRDLLVDAYGKRRDLPYAVFAELNLPPDDLDRQPPDWLAEVDQTVKQVVADLAPGTTPFDVVYFTNTPYHYGLAGEPSPSRVFANWIPVKPPSQIPAPLQDELVKAVQQFGNIPREYPVP